jgi:hypothetical protein
LDNRDAFAHFCVWVGHPISHVDDAGIELSNELESDGLWNAACLRISQKQEIVGKSLIVVSEWVHQTVGLLTFVEIVGPLVLAAVFI